MKSQPAPTILLAILARDKEGTLPLYLKCIEELDYNKSKIFIYIKTNDNSDNTLSILTAFYEANGSKYAHIEFDFKDINSGLTRGHEWNFERFKVLGEIRNNSLQKTLEYGCDFYFVVDCDNFILPHTLQSLVSHNLTIVAPMLGNDSCSLYSNFHYEVDSSGYYANHPYYEAIFSRVLVGLIQVKVVHCTYLVRADAIPQLTYDDGSGRYEYVIFSDSARRSNIPQYLDNTQKCGVITFKTKTEEMQNFAMEKYL